MKMLRGLPAPPSWAMWALVISFFIAYPISSVLVAFTDRTVPVYYIAGEALQPSAPVGGTMRVKFETNRFRNCAVDKMYRYARNIRTDTEYVIPEYSVRVADLPEPGEKPKQTDANKIGHNVFVRSFVVPLMPVGPAETYNRIYYECNWTHVFNPIIVETPRVRFEVTPGESK